MSLYNSIAKARSGIYEDNSKNRRLHRVGQHYGDPAQRDDEPLDKRSRVNFPDVPHSSKVNLKKYLSGSMRKRFDMTETFQNLKTADDVQKFHDRMIGYFEENFDKMSKADRAGWLWVIIQSKGELVKRLAAGDPNGEPIALEDVEVDAALNERIGSIVKELRENRMEFVTTQASMAFMDLSDEEKDAVLRETGFSGMVYRDGFYGDGGSLDVRSFEDKDSIMAQIKDDTYYNPIDSDSSWTIAYNDGKIIDTSDHIGETMKINPNGVKWIMGWGLRGYTYYSENGLAEADMMNYIGLDKWEGGQKVENKFQENNETLSGMLGGQKPMTKEEANEGHNNPHFKEHESYRINCQSCVVSYELRRRGFDVEALPRTTKEQDALAHDQSVLFIDPATGRKPESKGFSGLPLGVARGYDSDFTKANLKANFEKLTETPGRYHFSYIYTANRRRYGHIICVERFDDGRLVMYDPQNGKTRTWRDISVKMRKRYVHQILRVDDKLINTNMVMGIVKKSGK